MNSLEIATLVISNDDEYKRSEKLKDTWATSKEKCGNHSIFKITLVERADGLTDPVDVICFSVGRIYYETFYVGNEVKIISRGNILFLLNNKDNNL